MTASTNLGDNNSHCVTINATGNVTFTRIQTAQIPAQKPWFRTQPLGKNNHLSLLRWDRRVCERVGRDAEFDELLSWTHDGDPGIEARLITGDGGTGKSRLAGDLAQELVKRGWRAEKLADRLTEQVVLPLGGFQPREGKGTLAERTPTRQTVTKPAYMGGLLIVIDYPEGRMPLVERLLESLRDYAVQDDIRIRLLLLSRRDSQEWDPLIERARAEGLFQTDAIHLGRSIDPAAQFVTILNGLATALKQAVPVLPTGEPEKWLANNRAYQQPLFMAAVALHFCLHPEAGLTLGGPDAVTALVDRERSRAANESIGLGWEPDVLPRLLALATLRGGLDSAKLNELGQMLGVPAGPDLCDRLRHGCDGRIRDNVLVALEPDLPGAAFATLVLSERTDMAPDWIWQTIADNPMGLIPRLEQVCHDAEGTLNLLTDLPDMRISRLLSTAVRSQPRRAESLYKLTTERQSHRLSELAQQIATTLLEFAPILTETAQLLNDQSQHLRNTGRIQDALTAVNKAIKAWRDLQNKDSDKFSTPLVRSLINRCGILLEIGEKNSALSSIDEAIEILKSLGERKYISHRVEWGMVLNFKSIVLSEINVNGSIDVNYIVELAKKSSDILKSLLEDGENFVRPDFAESLVNLANRYREAGDIYKAIETLNTAETIYLDLKIYNSATYMPYIAEVLKNKSLFMAQIGDIDGFMNSSRESVHIYRNLSLENPELFNHKLSMSMCVHAEALFQDGQSAEALKLAEEAYRLIHAHAKAYPKSQSGHIVNTIRDIINSYRNIT